MKPQSKKREQGKGVKVIKGKVFHLGAGGAGERERHWVKLGRWKKGKESESLSTEACRCSLKKIAPSSLLYYITLVDKKNPTSSKVITAQ